MTLKVQHKRSAVRGKAPLPTDLEFGEIAINYEASNPSFYIKDSAGAIRRIGSQPGALVFKGSLAPTAAAPTAPNIGDVYVMSADGTMAASWVGVAGRLVVRSENIAWSGTEWESLGNDRVHGIHIGETPPATPSPGQQWFRSSTGKLYVYYDDGAGAAQWVVANPQEAVDYTQVYKKAEADTKFVDVAGDTMTGNLTVTKAGDGFAAVVVDNPATSAGALTALQLKNGGKDWELAARSETAANRPGWLTVAHNGVAQAAFTKEGALRVGAADDFQNVGQIFSVSSGVTPCFALRNSTAAFRKAWTIDADAVNSLKVINNGGSGVFIADGATAWSALSDETLKDVTGGFPTAVADVKSLRPVRFTWKSDASKHPNVGLIAQDVQRVLPEAVSTAPGGKLAVAYTDLVPLLTAALQEAIAKIETLETKVAALEVKP